MDNDNYDLKQNIQIAKESFDYLKDKKEHIQKISQHPEIKNGINQVAMSLIQLKKVVENFNQEIKQNGALYGM